MTVLDLKKIIANLPDDMQVGDSGHFGEKLECYYAQVMDVRTSLSDNTLLKMLCINIESPGDEPDYVK